MSQTISTTPTPTPKTSTVKVRRSSGPRRPLTGALFVAPSAIVVALLFVVPLGILIWMSFTDWPLLGSPTPNGLDNYAAIPDDKLFVGAVSFTLLYTAVTTVIIFFVSFVLVSVANTSRRGKVFYRTAFFLPYVVGTAAAALMWFVDIDTQVGIFNRILLGLGLVDAPVSFLDTPTRALMTTVALVVWKFIGFQVVVLLVGLQSVPVELYEAARIDGANTVQRLRFITLPWLRPTLALLFMLSVTGSLLAFDQFYVLTRGGPDNSTVTLVLAIYNRAFTSFELGRAAALSVVLMLVLIVLNAVQLRLIRTEDS